MDRLMEKLAMSKAIMDKTEGIKRGEASSASSLSSTQNLIQDFDMPAAKYNIPSEYLQEERQQPVFQNEPRANTKPVGVPSVDAIKNSKLPDEIKRLMMEHPIAQPAQQSTTISDDIIERAARLMKENGNNYVPESAKPKTEQPKAQPTNNSSIDYKLIQKMINEAVKSALKENGLITESSEKSNEIFSFKVGKHVFEGKVNKIKKLS
jgi:hypothetical protein